jgi:site-specific DNA-methyltransferase (adenine-specific)
VTNQLFFGDNLDVLRESLKDESVDLIYLDPPFNSSASYNILFASPTGDQSHAQIEAFEDTWHWTDQAEKEFSELLAQSNTDVAEVIRALRQFLGENDMMAYLVMMANRLLELRRVLKQTGSLYLHCDPTASHYLKIVLDGVFGVECFRNEIIWKRTSAHNDPRKYGNVHDCIFFYTKSENWTWNRLYTPYTDEYKSAEFRDDGSGRLVKYENLTAPSHGRDSGRDEWRGTQPPLSRMWRFSIQKREELLAQGLIKTTPEGKPIMRGLKTFLDELPGVPLQTVWVDIDKVGNTSGERLGYPTQKPLALLERIISASSKIGDVVLDPFCGCGTAVHASQKLGRTWIGVDITHLAITLIEKRLKDAFPGISFEVHGTPKDLDGARNLAERDKYQFQWWACSLVNAQPYQGKKKGADTGIDGLIFFQDDKGPAKKIVVSVKGGENVTVSMIRDFAHVVDRERAQIGLFVSLVEPTKPMTTEAVTAGYYTSPATGAQFQKIQILTIEGLLNHQHEPAYPHLDAGAATFKKAQVEMGTDEQHDWIASGLPAGKKGGKRAAKKQ